MDTRSTTWKKDADRYRESWFNTMECREDHLQKLSYLLTAGKVEEALASINEELNQLEGWDK